MKKNLLAITACFMACLLLAGCGAARNETGSSQPSETLTGAETTAASETTAKESGEVASVTEPTAKTTQQFQMIHRSSISLRTFPRKVW